MVTKAATSTKSSPLDPKRLASMLQHLSTQMYGGSTTVMRKSRSGEWSEAFRLDDVLDTMEALMRTPSPQEMAASLRELYDILLNGMQADYDYMTCSLGRARLLLKLFDGDKESRLTHIKGNAMSVKRCRKCGADRDGVLALGRRMDAKHPFIHCNAGCDARDGQLQFCRRHQPRPLA